MRDGTWSARLALLKIHEEVQAAIEPEELRLLAQFLAQKGVDGTERMLRAYRDPAQELLQLTPAQRRKYLGALEPGPSLLTRYAAIAWSAKAVALFECLERSSIGPTDPQKWAGPAGLRLVFEYEDWPDWLWPFEEPLPWPDDDDENEEP